MSYLFVGEVTFQKMITYSHGICCFPSQTAQKFQNSKILLDLLDKLCVKGNPRVFNKYEVFCERVFCFVFVSVSGVSHECLMHVQ